MPERTNAGGSETEVFFRAPALHGLRIRNAELHDPFLLEPRERRIDGPDGNRPAGARLDLAADRDAVGVVALVRDREHHVELEFADEITFRHVYSTNAYLDERQCRKVYPPPTRHL